eukprot:scaffold2836_cov99-Cylindrotheca_fusiformis.AAC.8
MGTTPTVANIPKRKMQASPHTFDPSTETSSYICPLEQSLSSAMSAVTMEDDPSPRFDPILKPMLENEQSYHEDGQVREYMERVKMDSSLRFSTTLGPSTETELCAMPRRKDSCADSDYETASDDCSISDYGDDNNSLNAALVYSTFNESDPELQNDIMMKERQDPACPILSTGSLFLDDMLDPETGIHDNDSIGCSVRAVGNYIEFLQRQDRPEYADDRFQGKSPEENSNDRRGYVDDRFQVASNVENSNPIRKPARRGSAWGASKGSYYMLELEQPEVRINSTMMTHHIATIR